jgi:hypothetical protein
MEAQLLICTKEEMRGVIHSCLRKVLNLWKLFVECRLNTVITVYCAVKFTSGQITSKREELLYVMRRDQEGRQRQGLRTILKPLKE